MDSGHKCRAQKFVIVDRFHNNNNKPCCTFYYNALLNICELCRRLYNSFTIHIELVFEDCSPFFGIATQQIGFSFTISIFQDYDLKSLTKFLMWHFYGKVKMRHSNIQNNSLPYVSFVTYTFHWKFPIWMFSRATNTIVTITIGTPYKYASTISAFSVWFFSFHDNF